MSEEQVTDIVNRVDPDRVVCVRCKKYYNASDYDGIVSDGSTIKMDICLECFRN